MRKYIHRLLILTTLPIALTTLSSCPPAVAILGDSAKQQPRPSYAPVATPASISLPESPVDFPYTTVPIADSATGVAYVQKTERATVQPQDLRLVFVDHFDSLNYQTWNRSGEGAKEGDPGDPNLVFLIKKDPDLTKPGNSLLHLRGMINPDEEHRKTVPYLTGAIDSRNKFMFQYGRIDIRAKLDEGQGVWPAIWLRSPTGNAEIDISEHLNFDAYTYQVIHTQCSKEGRCSIPVGTVPIKKNDFNIFTTIWSPDKIILQVNGVTSLVYKKNNDEDGNDPNGPWPFNQPLYIIIGQQVGPDYTWQGPVNVEALAKKPLDVIVDWIKIYQ